MRRNDFAGSAPDCEAIKDNGLVSFDGGVELGLAVVEKEMLASVFPLCPAIASPIASCAIVATQKGVHIPVNVVDNHFAVCTTKVPREVVSRNMSL